MQTGSEWLIDARGCLPTALGDLDCMRALCDEIIVDLELHVMGRPQWHQFPAPGGVTGMYLLSESHLTCHTFPELGIATFNLYCCRPRKAWPWERRLHEQLGAARIAVREIARGLESAPREPALFPPRQLAPLNQGDA
jgi:S-adenosylmethionine decarboxylase